MVCHPWGSRSGSVILVLVVLVAFFALFVERVFQIARYRVLDHVIGPYAFVIILGENERAGNQQHTVQWFALPHVFVVRGLRNGVQCLAGGRGVGEFRHILHIASHAHRQIIHKREQRFGAIIVLGREQKRVDFVYAQSQVAACARVITGLQGIARDSLHGFDEFCVVTGFAVRIAVLTDMNNETFMASADCVEEHGLCVDQRD